jgi:hypothetical protein
MPAYWPGNQKEEPKYLGHATHEDWEEECHKNWRLEQKVIQLRSLLELSEKSVVRLKREVNALYNSRKY